MHAMKTHGAELLWAAAVATGVLAMAAPARAQELPTDAPAFIATTPTVQAISDGSFAPLTLPARVGSTAAFAWGLSGYDTSRKAGLFDAIAEVRLWGPVALRGGATYSNTSDRLRPNIGARVQVLRQEAHGVDGSVSVFYKPEGFTEAEGEIETTVALAHAFDGLTVAGNLVYGQDPEGNERDGELRLNLFRRRGRLAYGLDARARFALGTQKGRAASREPTVDALGGPLVTVALGPVAPFAEIGPSVVRLGGDIRAGVTALGGIGAAF